MTSSVLGTRSMIHTLLAEITFEAGTLKLCEMGKSIFESNVQTYMPRILEISDIPEDNDSIGRFTITIQQKGPYYFDGAVYPTFNELLQVHRPWNKEVTVKHRGNNGAAINTVTITTGRITRVSDITQTTVTLECEPRESFAEKHVPMRKLDKDTFSTAAYNAVVPKDVHGTAIPMAFGDPFAHVLHEFAALTRQEVIDRLYVYGVVRPPTFALLEMQREAQFSRFTWAEHVNLTVPVSAAEQASENPMAGFAWISEADAWAQIWPVSDAGIGLGGITFPLASHDGRAFQCTIDRQPYMRVPLRCTRFVGDESQTEYTNIERAIDGRQETYATVTNTTVPDNEAVCFEMRQISPLGHISYNTNDNGGTALIDWEGAAKPAGIKAYAVLRFPTGTTVPTSGTLYLGIKFPGATRDKLFVETSFSIAQLTTLGMQTGGLIVVTHNVRVADPSDGSTGSRGDGWAGTKFERWDFTQHPDFNATGPDQALTRAASRDGRPFRVELRNQLNQPIYLVNIGVLVGFINELPKETEAFIERQRRRAKLSEDRAEVSVTGRRDRD